MAGEDARRRVRHGTGFTDLPSLGSDPGGEEASILGVMESPSPSQRGGGGTELRLPSRFSTLVDGLVTEHNRVTAENRELRAELSNLHLIVESDGFAPITPSAMHGAKSNNMPAENEYEQLSTHSNSVTPKNTRYMVAWGDSGANNPQLPGALVEKQKADTNRTGKELWSRARQLIGATGLSDGMSDEELQVVDVWRNKYGLGNKDETGTAIRLDLRRSHRAYWSQGHELDKCFLQKFVVAPDTRKRLAWDLLSLVCLAYDVLLTPFKVFDVEETDFQKVADTAVLIFWTFDICLTFFVGFHTSKRVEMRISAIAKQYFRSWFVLDFVIVLLEWLSVNSAGIVRMGKFVRLTRILRMMRLIKAKALLEQMNDYLRSESALVAFQIGKLIIFILVVNHLAACGWWAVGAYATDSEPRWTLPLQDAGWQYRYLVSLHWALTQFTPASMEVFPTNTPERAYAIVMLMLGLGAFSSFLSSISAMMTHLRTLRTIQAKEDTDVRRYMVERNVSMELGNCIACFLRENRKSSRKKRLGENDVKALSYLPDGLHMRLHWEIFGPSILPHPLFFDLNQRDHYGVIEICHRVMKDRQLGLGHELFHLGKKADSMFFVSSGSLNYYPGRHAPQSAKAADRAVRVEEAQWMSEMVLWMDWIHRGTIVARADTELVELQASLFHGHVQHRDACFELCRRYASIFVQNFLGAQEESEKATPSSITGPMNDLWGSADSIRDLVHLAAAQVAPKKLKKTKSFVLNMMLRVFAGGQEDPEDSQQLESLGQTMSLGQTITSMPSSTLAPASGSKTPMSVTTNIPEDGAVPSPQSSSHLRLPKSPRSEPYQLQPA